MVIERIDNQLCNGCGICINTCSMDVIRMDSENKKAIIKYPEECMSCAYCEMDCPVKAIYVSPYRYAPIAQGWF
jgi:NAD-dependent dihydropyrimidine dehydrogenase PreA subunit